MERRSVYLDFSAEVDRVSHRGLLYKLRSIGVGELVLPIMSQFLSDRQQRASLDSKVSVSVDVVSEVLQGSVLGPLLIILYTSELFQIIENHMVGYAEDTKICAVSWCLNQPTASAGSGT